MDFMHRNLAANEGFEEEDCDSEDSNGEDGEPASVGAAPGTRTKEVRTRGTVGGNTESESAGLTKKDLLEVFAAVPNHTKDIIDALAQPTAPTPTIPTMDPELKDFIQLKHNLPNDVQADVDNMAREAMRKLRARLSRDGGAQPDNDNQHSANATGAFHACGSWDAASES